MIRQYILSLLFAALVFTGSHAAYGQISASVGVHGGYEVEHGGTMIGASGILDVGMPLRLGVSLDYLSTELEGFQTGEGGSSEGARFFILGSEVRADLLPSFLPATIYVSAGPSIVRDTPCEDRDCTRVGVEGGLGVEAFFGKIQPFAEAKVLRAGATFYLVRGGLRLGL